MKKMNFAIRLAGALIIYWIIYNTYFGWNEKPLSQTELNLDNIYKYGMYFCTWLYFLPLLDVYERFIEKHERKS